MIICIECKKEMRCDKNGVGANFGNGYVYPGDRYKCPDCGRMILRTNYGPIHDPDLKFQDEYLNIPKKEID